MKRPRDLQPCLTDTDEGDIMNALGKVAATAFPNPTRDGCPDDSVLALVAARSLDIVAGADTINHVASCSPCFQRVQALRRRSTTRRRAAGGAGLALFGALTGWAWYRSSRPPAPVHRFTATLDLRKAPIMRGAPRSNAIVGQLPRGLVTLTVFLPIGSLPGTYSFVLANSGRALASPTTATVTRQGGADATTFELDTTHAKPGDHQLLVRHESLDWTAYAIVLE